MKGDQGKKSKAAIIDLIDSEGLDVFDEAPALSPSPHELIKMAKEQAQTNTTEEIKLICPTRCEPWKYADRHELEMGDISSLAQSIKSNGQQEPILLRRSLQKNAKTEFEIIFGNRRWRACKSINQPIKAIIKTISDQEAAIAQQEENAHRQDISDYSRAINIKKPIDENVFSSIDNAAKYLGMGKTTIVDLLSFTRIPQKIMSGISNPTRLSIRAAIQLASIGKEKEDKIVKFVIKSDPFLIMIVYLHNNEIRAEIQIKIA